MKQTYREMLVMTWKSIISLSLYQRWWNGSTQQKVIELQEREGRKENVVIIGLKEEREEDSAATVKDFLKKELDLDDVHITKAFRLGKGRNSGDRPVLE